MHGIQGCNFHLLDVIKSFPPVGITQAKAIEQAIDGGVVKTCAAIHADSPLGNESLEIAPGVPVVWPDLSLFGKVINGQTEVFKFFGIWQAGVTNPRCLG
jgi:hypothetical protein